MSQTVTSSATNERATSTIETPTITPTATYTVSPTANPIAVKKLVLGTSFVLGLRNNGKLVTWGINTHNQSKLPSALAKT
jgi:alpha-tubulin suppressor-like RCC1 family protein